MGLIPNPDTSAALIRRLLDRGYTDATDAVIRAIVTNGSSGVLDQRLRELDAEVARLASEGKKFDPNNPVVRALLADFDDVMRVNGALVNSVAADVQWIGANAAGPVVRQLALPGFSDADLARIGIAWNVPNPDAVASVVDMVTSDAFGELMSQYVTGTSLQARNVLINGFVAGRGSLANARAFRQAIQGLPAHNANTVLRTLELTAFRNAQVVHRVENAHILEYQIRIATLDDRTCMSCVAQHGEELPIDARIDDHHAGRCTSITKVRGLQAPEVETGVVWFGRQSESRQRTMMGNAAFDAWKDGAIAISDYPQQYSDPVFGTMIREASLKGMIGEQAKEYYSYAS